MCLPETFPALQRALSRRGFLACGAHLAAAASLAPTAAFAQNAPRQLSYSTVQDLTHVLGTQTPVFPGFAPPKIEVTVSIENNGFYGNTITSWEHVGTHLDAPAHFSPTGLFVDQIPASALVAPLAVVDIAGRATTNPDTALTPDDILAWERRYGRLPEGAAVFVHSGWAARYGDADAFLNADTSQVLHFPGFGLDAVEFLLNERAVVGIGVDTLSLDIGAATEFVAHSTWLGANRWGIENLANLSQVPPSGAVVVVGAPRLASGSGGPTRVLALY